MQLPSWVQEHWGLEKSTPLIPLIVPTHYPLDPASEFSQTLFGE